MTAIPKRLVKLVLARDKGRCVLNLPGCLINASVADHRADRGHGGSQLLNDPAALIAACGLCNGRKTEAHGAELARLYERGLKVLKDSTNEKTLERCRITEVVYPDQTVCLLTSSGLRLAVVAAYGEVN